MSKQSSSNNSDRRSYFRLEDKVYIEYTPVSKEQAEAFSRSKANNPQARDEDSLYLDALSRQIATVLASMRGESALMVQAIDLLNRKLDYIAGIIFFDKYRTHATESAGIRARTVDISEGGISLNSRTPIAADSYLQVRIIIVSARLGFETIGKVVNCRELQHQDIHYFRIGIEFPYLHESDRRSLARHIMDRQREQIRSSSKPVSWEDVHS